MKVEHRDAIERAKLHGVHPMILAHQLMVKDLVEAALFELRNNKAPFGRLNEEDQQEVIDRITEQAEEAVTAAIGIISSRSTDTIPFKIADSKFKEKNITVTGVVDAQDPNRHGLIDLSGKLVLLVLAPNDYNDGLDGIRAERDQRELPLSASEIVSGMGLDRRQEAEELPDGPDPLYPEGLAFVQSTRRVSVSAVQRHLKIGYNRAARMIEQMEADGVVTPSDSNGGREVIARPEQQQDQDSSVHVSKEFGDYDYEEAMRLLIAKAKAKPFKAAWIQSQLAISSDQVSTLLLRLLDDKVIVVEKEGESALEHSYKIDKLLAEAS